MLTFLSLGPREGSQVNGAERRRTRGKQCRNRESEIAIVFNILQEKAPPVAVQGTANIFNRSQSLIFKDV